MLLLWAQTSTGTAAANELPPATPQYFQVEVGLRSLINPGVEDRGLLWVQALSGGLSVALIPEALGVALTVPMAVASNLRPEDGSTHFILGGPNLLLLGGVRVGKLRGNLGLGFGLPASTFGETPGVVQAGVGSLNGGALAYQWTSELLLLAKLEMALEWEAGWLSLNASTALPKEDIKPSGDVQLEGGYWLNDTVGVGGRVGVARYQVPVITERVVRICLAADPRQCPAGPPPEGFALDAAVVRVEPFVRLNVDPLLRFSWTFLVASDNPVDGLHDRHEFTVSCGKRF